MYKIVEIVRFWALPTLFLVSFLYCTSKKVGTGSKEKKIEKTAPQDSNTSEDQMTSL